MAKQKSTSGGKSSRAKAGGKTVQKTAKKTPVRKPASAKKHAGKKSPGSAAGKARVTKVAKKPAARTSSASKSSKSKSSRRKSSAKSLGRPRVPGDARLDLIFQKDYQAREVFEFLGVATVRDLERFGPDEIIRKLTSPMVQTVGRIRKALAVANRSLADDTEFAIEFREQYMSGR